jgi:hypothetical protein
MQEVLLSFEVDDVSSLRTCGSGPDLISPVAE